MRIGLIGTGRIGSFHAAALARHPDAGSLLLADADPARAARLADRLGATAAPTVEQVFTWGVDAVVVCCSTDGHAELIVRAVRGGLPVFCEKPVAPDLTRTLGVLREVTALGGVLQLGFMRRFDEGYAAARELVRSGALGRLHTVRTTTADPTPPTAAYLAGSGGLYRDCLVHDFDMVRWVTGHEVTEVYAAGSDAGPSVFRETGDVDTAVAVLTLDDGTLVSSTGTRCNGAGYDVRMELAGERDQVSAGLDDRTPIASTEPHGPPAASKPWTGFLERFAPAYEAELAAFVRLVRGEGPNPCDGREALAALRIAEACELSRRERRRVRLEELPDL
ncbi:MULTISPECIES: Gfo/Idh/MocA family oxidoreductase [unclassified Streptomyces]|uniref:Gfo/Idh/MocA family protein n=1 Tax=unclassified Streptomyces TaxID=2593676 RepID=UPI00226F87BD|nr:MULTISPECIES: Gfo/Idh/MocA family oxidoreductase [unclassified Streptomyces]MCY0918890.1 Gfo/Idh/MocA family oxidoreductase [Streptomyces sp. H27-G5]MCY0955594.1 Gfo/Idh/MocA family oxidoreductase [Streptomyces sp. H27-H5]